MSKKLFKNSSYYMIASLLPITVSFIMLPIYSRYLTPEDYGVIALVLSLQAFLPLIMTFQIHSSISRFYFDYKDNLNNLNVFITTILVSALILASIVLFIIITYLENILYLILPKTIGYNDIFLLGIISTYFYIFTTAFITILRVQQKAKLFMKTSLYLFIISLSVNVFEVIILERGSYGILEASLIMSIISCIVYFWLIKEFTVMKFKFSIIIDPIKYSLPLIPHSMSGLIFMYSDRIILEKYVTLSAIGLYMFSDKIATVFKMIVNEFNNAFIPYFNEKSLVSKEEAIKDVQNISLYFIYFISMLIIFVALFSVEMVYWLFDERYFSTWKMIPLLSSAYVFRSLYCFSSSGIFYEKKTGKIALITIFAGIANITLNIYLIPIYGIMIAIYTTIFSFFITFVMSEIMSYKIYYLQLNIKKNIIIVTYMFSAIFFSLYLNNNFHEFGYIEYLYKMIVLMIGLAIGYRLGLLNFTKLLKI
jgi:O-antigen/teichoic acid export membrane protein